jgi:hypothetical protein
MSSMTMLIVCFLATNSDALDRVQATIFIVWKAALYIDMTSFPLCYNSHEHTPNPDSYLSRIRPRGSLQIMDPVKAVFEVSSLINPTILLSKGSVHDSVHMNDSWLSSCP